MSDNSQRLRDLAASLVTIGDFLLVVTDEEFRCGLRENRKEILAEMASIDGVEIY